MTSINLKIMAVALSFAASLATGSANAETGFKALEGISAKPMSAAEMDQVQGRFFVLDANGYIISQLSNQYVQYDSASGWWYTDTPQARLYYKAYSDGIVPYYGYDFATGQWTTYSGMWFDYAGNLNVVNGLGSFDTVNINQLVQQARSGEPSISVNNGMLSINHGTISIGVSGLTSYCPWCY